MLEIPGVCDNCYAIFPAGFFLGETPIFVNQSPARRINIPAGSDKVKAAILH